MNDSPSAAETASWQRRLAIQANDRAWALSETPFRSPEEDEEMIQAAHAAMHFWNIVGSARNRAHAAQLVAHAYSLLGLGNPAKHYLAKAQPFFAGEGVEPWELALAHAIAANVAAAAGDTAAHRSHHTDATRLVTALADPADRDILNATLAVIPRPIEVEIAT